MNSEAVKRSSKTLSWLLRHGAEEARLAMDPAGWVAVADVLAHLRIDRRTLEAVVAENDKRRLELVGERVRACQGHSREGVPVTLEALEASWRPYAGGPRVWHGTALEALTGIGARGIEPSARTHVHLAEALDSRVGKRAKVQVMLAVSVERMTELSAPLFVAPNGVILTRRVPVAAIEGVVATSRKARARARAGDGPFPWLEA